MKGWSAFTKNGDDDKKVKSTISDRKAKKINVENVSAVQEKDGKKFVVEVGDNEYYDPSEKDGIGGKSGKWEGNYNDTNNRRDTMVVNNRYKVGDLIDETEWEKGKAFKKNKKKSALKYTPQSQRGKVDSDKVYEVDREGGKKSGWKYKVKDGKWHASDNKRTGGKYVSIEDNEKFKSSVDKMNKLHPDAKGDKWSRKKKKRSEMFADSYTPQSKKKTEKSPMTLIELEQTGEYQDSDPRRRDLMKERVGISNDSQKVMNDPSIDPKRKKLILKSLEKADIEIQNQMQK